MPTTTSRGGALSIAPPRPSVDDDVSSNGDGDEGNEGLDAPSHLADLPLTEAPEQPDYVATVALLLLAGG